MYNERKNLLLANSEIETVYIIHCKLYIKKRRNMATQTIARKKVQIKKATKKEKPFDFVLFATVLVLLGIGIVMVLSASSPSALATTGSSYTFVSRQAIAAVIGIVLMLVISKIDYKQYPKFYKVVYMISVARIIISISSWIRKSGWWC